MALQEFLQIYFHFFNTLLSLGNLKKKVLLELCSSITSEKYQMEMSLLKLDDNLRGYQIDPGDRNMKNLVKSMQEATDG